MSTTALVVGVSVVIVLVITVVTFLLWSSRIGPRRGENPATRYRREMRHLHSPRNLHAERARRRRQMWAAGTAGAVGIYYTGAGEGYEHNCGDSGFDGGGGGDCGGGDS